jgi:hypothetical protein
MVVNKYYAFLLAAIVIGTWWIISDRTYYKAGTTEELINYVSTNASAILRFADTLTPCGLADSAFEASAHAIGPLRCTAAIRRYDASVDDSSTQASCISSLPSEE